MIIRVGNISLQRFQPEHTDVLYELINRPEVRKGMKNSAEIPYESHLFWVKENLIEGNNVHLFVVINEGRGLGAALIKNITYDSGELGIMVRDIISSRKMLLTSKLLTGILYYAFHKMNFQYLNIRILPDNIDSINTANKIGADFQSQDETYQHFVLMKTKYESFPLNKLLLKRYIPTCVKSKD
jgi:RimJ/RimL family protein N-acetyltransferase